MRNNNNIILLDLFSGAGGFTLGLMQAGFTFRKHYFSEVNKFAIGVYKYHFKEAIYAGAIEEIKKGKIEKPDIVCFGSPCQDISIAGQGQGLKGSKSRLFFEAIRLIKEYKPSIFIFENVKGIFSSNKGKDFETVLKTIADIGLYDCEWQLLNTSWFLPQNRERFYLVGHLRKKSRPQVFPIEQCDIIPQKSRQKRSQSKAIASTITASYSVKARGENYVTLNGVPIIIGGIKNDTIILGGGYLDYAQGERIYSLDGISPTITTNIAKQPIFPSGKKFRRLTPLECEKLQGFPDNWTKYGIHKNEIIEISDTQRYSLMGNAVSVPVIKAIGRKLISSDTGILPIEKLITLSIKLQKQLRKA